MWAGSGGPNFPGADVAPPAERRDLTHPGTPTERGKPVAVPLGRHLARGADAVAGRGGGRKRRPLCNGAERGCAARQHHPARKGADFPLVLQHEEARPTASCTHSPPAGLAPVRGRGRCQHADGDGARRDGRAHPGERALHIVTDNKPQVRAGWRHKGPGAGTGIPPCRGMGIPRARWTARASPMRCAGDGTGEPRTLALRDSAP